MFKLDLKKIENNIVKIFAILERIKNYVKFKKISHGVIININSCHKKIKIICLKKRKSKCLKTSHRIIQLMI